MREVVVLLTYDIHTHAYPAADVDVYLRHVLEVHGRLGMPASFLFPAEAAEHMPETVRQLIARGHAVGCHGLTHRDEIYDRMSAEAQTSTLTEATERLSAVTGAPIRFFRAPVFRLSAVTMRTLDALGYDADLSVNSQRLGLLSSDPWNFAWLLAPRLPYHPDADHPYRPGGLRMWEIPLSCVVLPFMSNTLLAFGLSFMKLFFRLLCFEARRSGKPVVFMAHPEELIASRTVPRRRGLRPSDFLPTKYGFGFRQALMRTDPATIAGDMMELLGFIRRTPGVRFVTVPQYVDALGP